MDISFQKRGDAATGVKPHRRPRSTRDQNPYPPQSRTWLWRTRFSKPLNR